MYIVYKEILDMTRIERFRRTHLAVAEMINSWRVLPRIMVMAYMWLVYDIVQWYMNLRDYVVLGCRSNNIPDCISQSPSMQHAALVTVIVGAAAAIFAFYTRSGNPVVPKNNEEFFKIPPKKKSNSKKEEPFVFENRPNNEEDDNY
jgi:hypothetical protein